MYNSHFAKIIIIAIITLITSSCEYQYDYVYEVKNNAGGQLEIAYEFEGQTEDTVILGNGSRLVLHTEDHGNESGGGPFFQPVSESLLEMQVIKQDSLSSDRDFLQDSLWNFLEGNYQLVLEERYFPEE